MGLDLKIMVACCMSYFIVCVFLYIKNKYTSEIKPRFIDADKDSVKHTNRKMRDRIIRRMKNKGGRYER